jgi:hypothetical protein
VGAPSEQSSCRWRERIESMALGAAAGAACLADPVVCWGGAGNRLRGAKGAKSAPEAEKLPHEQACQSRLGHRRSINQALQACNVTRTGAGLVVPIRARMPGTIKFKLNVQSLRSITPCQKADYRDRCAPAITLLQQRDIAAPNLSTLMPRIST